MILYIFLLIPAVLSQMANFGQNVFKTMPIEEISLYDRTAGAEGQQSNPFTIMSQDNEPSFDYDHETNAAQRQDMIRPDMRRQFAAMRLEPDVAFGDHNDRFDLTGVYELPAHKFRGADERRQYKQHSRYEEQAQDDQPNFRRSNLWNVLNYRRSNYEDQPNYYRSNYEDQPNYHRSNYEDQPNNRRSNYEDQPNYRRSNYEDQPNYRRSNYEDQPIYRRSNNKDQLNRRFDFHDLPNYRDQANYGDQPNYEDQVNYGDQSYYRRRPNYRRDEDFLEDMENAAMSTHGNMDIALHRPRDNRHRRQNEEWDPWTQNPARKPERPKLAKAREELGREREIIVHYSLPVKIKVRDQGNASFITGINIL